MARNSLAVYGGSFRRAAAGRREPQNNPGKSPSPARSAGNKGAITSKNGASMRTLQPAAGPAVTQSIDNDPMAKLSKIEALQKKIE